MNIRLSGVLPPLLAIILLCSTSWTAFQFMMADAYGERIRISLDDWKREGKAIEGGAMKAHLQYSAKALEWSPLNPAYKDAAARLLLLRLPQIARQEERQISILTAYRLYQRSVTERPEWPYALADLAYVKGILGQYDEEFSHSLSKAIQYGPWEPASLQRIAQTGLQGWQYLGTEDRQITATAISRVKALQNGYIRSLEKFILEFEDRDSICSELLKVPAEDSWPVCSSNPG